MDYLANMFKYTFLRLKPDTSLMDEIKEINQLSAFENNHSLSRFNLTLPVIQMATPTTTDDEATDIEKDTTDTDSDDDTHWKKETQKTKEKLEKNQMLCNIL
jgi:hypothetical protein